MKRIGRCDDRGKSFGFGAYIVRVVWNAVRCDHSGAIVDEFDVQAVDERAIRADTVARVGGTERGNRARRLVVDEVEGPIIELLQV